MDRLESLAGQLSQITMYDIKSAYNQAKNVVLNVSEMEAKVREATNEDPWGASSTLMQEIAQGTFNFQQFNEIMPCIYSRFMEKEARQWRQIYKGLTLLEYLIKHGSERVVDDARAHLSMLKMLRSFHYIDDKGKDEGINVRNRSKELVELLSDVEKIRGERRKAKVNKGKYTGTGNDGLSFSSGGGRYGGFGNDSYSSGGGGGGGGYVNDHYSSYAGGSSNTSSSGGFRDESRRGGGFEEYDAGDDEDRSTPTSPARSQPSRTTPARKASAPAPAPAPAPVEDLLGGFDDDAFSSAPAPQPAANNVNKALPSVAAAPVGIDDDDFADFQAAPVQTTGTASPPAAAAPAKPNIMDLFGSTSAAASPTAGRPQAQAGFGAFQQQPLGLMNTGGSMGMGMGMGGMHRSTPSSTSQTPNYSSPQMQPKPLMGGAPLQPNYAQGMGTARPASTPMQNTQSQPKPASSSNFDDLWTMSLGSSAKPAAATAGKSIKDLEKEKSMASLWGNSKPAGQAQSRPMGASNAFGSFGNAAPPSSSGGGDDLLL